MSQKRIKQERPEKGDVMQQAIERTEYVFDNFDSVFCGFSGGKDSGATLNLLLDEWNRRDDWTDPIHLVHIDDEVVPPETEEFVKRMGRREETMLWWFCVPVEYPNGCSSDDLHWYPFNPEKPELWVREPPYDYCEETEGVELVMHDHPRMTEQMDGFKNWSFTEPEKSDWTGYFRQKDLNYLFFHRFNQNPEYDIEYGSIANCIGIRTAESLTRLRGILNTSTEDHGGDTDHGVPWISSFNGLTDFYNVKPIYDWKDHDIWTAHEHMGWDYNEAYDKLAMMGVPRTEWRTAQPFGVEPLKGLYWFKKCWPERWHKAKDRVPGAKAATQWGWDLYQAKKRGDKTWEETAIMYLEGLRDEEAREFIREKIQGILDRHSRHSTRPLPQSKACPYCEWSWSRIARNNARGEMKWRRGDH